MQRPAVGDVLCECHGSRTGRRKMLIIEEIAFVVL